MSNRTPPSPTTLDPGPLRVLVESTAARRAAAVAGFVVLTALAARVAIPLPGTPVPFTLQVAAVLLTGALLGPALGAAAQAAYVAAGAAGLPAFAAGGGLAYLLGPTGGYLLAYPAAAAAAGWLVHRRPGLGWSALGMAGGVAVIHAGGMAWLSVLSGPAAAFELGVLPFLLVDAVKAVAVLLVAERLVEPARELLGI